MIYKMKFPKIWIKFDKEKQSLYPAAYGKPVTVYKQPDFGLYAIIMLYTGLDTQLVNEAIHEWKKRVTIPVSQQTDWAALTSRFCGIG